MTETILARLRLAEQVDEEAIGTGHTFWQLTEEGQAGIDVYTLPDAGIDQPAGRYFLTRISQRKHGLVARIKLAPEVEPALLLPTFEVLLGNLVGKVEYRMLGRKEPHGRILVGDAHGGRADLGGVGRGLQCAPDVFTLVLHHQGPAGSSVIE